MGAATVPEVTSRLWSMKTMDNPDAAPGVKNNPRTVLDASIERQKSGNLPVVPLKGNHFEVEQPYAMLNNGSRIPLIGLGTYKGLDSTQTAVEAALRAGYQHIDCAARYGNETSIGKGISNVLKEGIVKRQNIFITSKLWNTNHAPDKVQGACEKTLKDLQLDYLDLYLIHWNVSDEHGWQTDGPTILETWEAMEKLVDAGLVKAIGVSNLSIKKLEALVKAARIQPSVNQVEVHPYFRNDDLIEWCRRHGIHVSAYCPLGTPSSSAKQVTRYAPSATQDPVLSSIAKAHNKSIQHTIIRWGVQHGTSVLPKSSNPGRIKDNLHQTVGWELTPEEYKRATSLDFQLRMVDGCQFVHPPTEDPQAHPQGGLYKSFTDLWDDDTEPQRGVFIKGLYTTIAIPSLKLNNGREMPILGLGTWKAPPGEVGMTVERGLRAGYRHVDCDGNEGEVGESLRLIFKEKVIERQDLHFTSQLMPKDCHPAGAKKAVDGTLLTLGLDYVDLFIIHWPHGRADDFEGTWKAMEAMVYEGKVHSLGVSNFDVDKLESLMDFAKVRPVINQVELNPNRRESELLRLCRDLSIEVMAYSPMSKSQPDTAKINGQNIKDKLLQSIAAKLNKHPGEVFLRWAIQHGTIVIPKAVSADLLQHHLAVLDWELSEEDYNALTTSAARRREVLEL
ncbi:hypothetical protein WJX84_010534 [Apatococcus fuscideae]|uniref:NADP-dependent oxidoreductase domain-containing protein n=1 Tax=Apatococcus fuscideae TaxID=2026836 RepID=A0AAW1T8I0_9CHLO